MTKIELEDGKYTIENDNGIMKFYRHGKEWNTGMEFSKLALAMVHRIEELEGTFKRLENPERHFPVEVFSPGHYSITMKDGNFYFQKMEGQTA